MGGSDGRSCSWEEYKCAKVCFYYSYFESSGDVDVCRTGLYDSGIGRTIFEMLMRDDPDRRVLVAVLMVCCNILNQYSPMREVSILFCFIIFGSLTAA